VSIEPTQRRPTLSTLRLVWLYPDLLSTYGDRGNLQVLAYRAIGRGIDVDIVEVTSDKHMPTEGDVYLIGGGEDGPQALAADRLRADGGLVRAVNRGAVVFSVCAGYQIMGATFMAKGEQHAGLGLLDIHSQRGDKRAVGELAGEVDPRLGLPTLTGFENHGGRTFIGPNAAPLAKVTHGIGNDGSTEGAWGGRIMGTYLHGPALARNPLLADLLLSWVTGSQLVPLDDTWPTALRNERLAAVNPKQLPPDANNAMELI